MLLLQNLYFMSGATFTLLNNKRYYALYKSFKYFSIAGGSDVSHNSPEYTLDRKHQLLYRNLVPGTVLHFTT